MESGGAAPFLDQFDQLERGTFADVGDVLLVGQTDDKDTRAAESLAGNPVQRLGQSRDHMAGHGRVDLSRQFDEAGGQVVLARFPGQIERVDRDAVPAQARAGIERHVAERFGLGGLDHLPDIHSHGLVDDLQLVHEGDVDGAEDVLGQLDRLGGGGGGDGNDGFHDGAVEGLHQFASGRTVTCNDLGNCRSVEGAVAGIFAFGREAEEEIRAGLEAGAFQDGPDGAVGGAGVGGGFECHQLAGAQGAGDVVAGAGDVGEVGFAVSGQGRGDADDDDVAGAQQTEIGGSREAARVRFGGKGGITDGLDVAFSGGEGLKLGGVDVKACDAEPRLRGCDRQRQTDIAKADHPNRCAARGNQVKQRGVGHSWHLSCGQAQ